MILNQLFYDKIKLYITTIFQHKKQTISCFIAIFEGRIFAIEDMICDVVESSTMGVCYSSRLRFISNL